MKHTLEQLLHSCHGDGDLADCPIIAAFRELPRPK
jgi:hypothetical protein